MRQTRSRRVVAVSAARRIQRVGNAFQCSHDVVVTMRQARHFAAFRHQAAGQVPICEEAHGRFGTGEHQQRNTFQRIEHLLREVRHARNGGQPGSRFDARRKRTREQLAPGHRGDATSRAHPGLAQCDTVEQQHALRIETARHRIDHIVRHARPLTRADRSLRGKPAFVPRTIGRHDQRRNVADRVRTGRHRGAHRGAAFFRQNRRRRCRADPRRDRFCHAFDVGRERCIVGDVVDRVVANYVDEGRAGAPGVVQIRDRVAEAGAQMQQRQRRHTAHAPIAVGGPAADAFEQRQHRSHLRHRIDRLHKVHLRRARIRETTRHAGIDERSDQRLGAVHVDSPGAMGRIVAGPAASSCRSAGIAKE